MSYEYKGSDALIWQPNTNVRSFPSGLLQVTRTAIVRRTGLAAARQQVQEGDPLPCDAPATDGVYIFPTAEERDLGSGFVELVATGYGRSNSRGRNWTITASFQYLRAGRTHTQYVQLNNRNYAIPSSQGLPFPNVTIYETLRYAYEIETSVTFTDYGRFRELLVSENLNVTRTTPAA
jgi:hypothetical protein